MRLVEELSIGTLLGDPHYEFAAINGFTVGHNGDIYVVDLTSPGGSGGPMGSSPSEIRQFTSAGVYVRNIGRMGQGPGEFASPLGLTAAPNGDILTFDASTNHVNVYDSAGKSRATWMIPSGTLSTASRMLLADSSGGAYVPSATSLSAPGGARQLVLHFAYTGTVTDTLANPTCAQPAVNGPFQPICQRAFHPSGRFIIGWSESYSFDLQRAGKPTTRIERDTPLEHLLPEEEAEWKARLAVARPQIARGSSRTLPDGRIVAETTFAPRPVLRTTKPAYKAFLLGLDGRIWVQVSMRAEKTSPPPQDPARPSTQPQQTWIEPVVYDVFEPDGRYLGRVRMPPKTTLRAMRGDYIWGTRTGDTDEPYLVRWRIVHGNNQ